MPTDELGPLTEGLIHHVRGNGIQGGEIIAQLWKTKAGWVIWDVYEHIVVMKEGEHTEDEIRQQYQNVVMWATNGVEWPISGSL